MLQLITVAVALLAAAAMEAWAALLHGRVWHGALWFIHRTHHERRRGRFEANDALSSLHAPIAATCIVWGLQPPHDLARHVVLGVGCGMTAFGVAYVLCHDGFVHRRMPLGFLRRVPYMQRIARAHRLHHARGGAPYGFFAAPLGAGLRHDAPPTHAPHATPTAPERRAEGTPSRPDTPRDGAPT